MFNPTQMEDSQTTAALMIPTDPCEKYTSLGETPKMHPRPSSDRGRKHAPDVTATFASRASGIAGLPGVEKDSILQNGSSHSKGQKLGSSNAVCADEKDMEFWNESIRICLQYLAPKKVLPVIKCEFKGLCVDQMKPHMIAAISEPMLFMISSTTIVEIGVDGYYGVGPSIPFHIMAVLALLNGNNKFPKIFNLALEKWNEVLQYALEGLIPECANEIVHSVVCMHARAAYSKHNSMVIYNNEPGICRPKAMALLSWIEDMKRPILKKKIEMDKIAYSNVVADAEKVGHCEATKPENRTDRDDHLKALVEASSSSSEASIIMRSMQDLARLPSAHGGNTLNHKEGNFTKVEKMSAMRNAGGVLKGPTGGIIKTLAKDVKEIKAMMRMLLEKQNLP